ncbi:MAG: sulfur carrier protein ThiS [Myxococcota bacterium]
MRFELNGEPREIPEPLSVEELLERFDLARRRVAVAINADVVRRSDYARVRIQSGDRIEVIQAVGGGR